jgi:hypothetical protein
MTTTFKPKIMQIFFRLADSTLVSVLRFLNFLLICSVSVVFCGEFVENRRAFAQEEEPQKCLKLKDPTTVSELQELRVCLKKLKFERAVENGIQTIKKSYEGSLKLTEKLNMMSDNKSSKKLPEES